MKVRARSRSVAERWLGRASAVIIGTAILAGCGGTQPAPGFNPSLKTVAIARCDHTGVSGTLYGSTTDRDVLWFELADRTRRAVAWPTGYHATFRTIGNKAILEVYDESGLLAATDSDWYPDTCASGLAGTVLLMSSQRMGLSG